MNEKDTKNINISVKQKITDTMPCVALRDLVVYPKMVMHFDVARPRSLNALRRALDGDRYVFLTAQKNVFIPEPKQEDLYKIGTVAEIKQIIKTPDGLSRVLVEGVYRAKLVDMRIDPGDWIEADIKKLSNYTAEKLSAPELTAVQRTVKEKFEEYSRVVPRMPKELYTAVLGAQDPVSLCESIMFNITMSTEDKQQLLELGSAGQKLVYMIAVLMRETEVLGIEKEINEQVNEQIDKNQREYYLREQLKAIQSQLGEGDSPSDDGFDYLTKIADLKLSKEVTEKLVSEANKLMKMPSASQEAAVIRGYLDTVLELPWNKYTKDKTDIKKAAQQLDKDHYGLKKVKERILEVLAVRQLAPDVKGQIICLAGPPGVGKTSIGKSIAKALGRKYVRVSLGGVKDESDIRGHRKTYVGSMPGRIITAMKQAGTMNPLILLDEIDKMSNDFKGDPSSAMLEVLDSEQNKEFRDHFIEVPFDLSEVLFITTANNLDSIAPPLLDRMDVIELSSYTREEKFNIAKRHLIPKQLKANGLKSSNMKITDEAVYALIDGYTKEAGVRNLERLIASLCRKACKEIIEEDTKKVVFDVSNRL